MDGNEAVRYLDDVALAEMIRSLSWDVTRAGVLLPWRDDPVGFITAAIDWPAGQYLTAYQREILAAIPVHKRVAVRGPHGLGKDLAVDTPLPTPTGWTTMGDVRAGDVLLDEQGKPCTVLHAEDPAWRTAYRVHFADGAVITAGAGHWWNAVDVYDRPRGITDWRDHWAATKTRTTAELAAALRSPGGQLRWRVPTARSLELPTADLPIDPYALGYWLGNGPTTGGSVTVSDADLQHVLAEYARAGYTSRGLHQERGCWTFTVSGSRPRVNSLQAHLRRAGLLGDKRIPPAYLRASTAQRMELVRGLWDSDGYRQGGGADEITLTCRPLALGVAELLRTLGLATRIHESRAQLNGRDMGQRWRIAARFEENPYKLPRYDWAPRGRQASRHTQRTITAVTPVGALRTRCIAVDSPSKLFLAGEDFVPTHNTSLAALTCLWFALTREAAGVDWKIATTAGAWRQLSIYLWPEIHKWAKRLRPEVIGRPALNTRTELLGLNIKLPNGAGFAVASDNPALIEGVHADAVLYIFDESKSIDAETFDAAEGAFSAAGSGQLEAFALATSTPGVPAGRFYDIHSRKPGFEDWWTRHVRVEEAIAAGRISRAWVDARRRQWGEDSGVFANRVLGEFHADDEAGLIPLAWVEAANDRWRAWVEAGRPRTIGRDTVGVDVARFGGDQTALAIRHGRVITELRRAARADTMTTTGVVAGILRANPGMTAVVDVIGVGGGVVDRLRELKHLVEAFNASESAGDATDRPGELGFQNVRSWAWWGLREQLDPAYGADLALPPDDLLTGDLTAPRWKVLSGGRIAVEDKDAIRKRIGRSTDDGDAVVQAAFEAGDNGAGAWTEFLRDGGGKPAVEPAGPAAPLTREQQRQAAFKGAR